MMFIRLLAIAFRELLRPARLIIAALLTIAPGAIALAWRWFSDGRKFDAEVAYNALEPGLVFGFVLVILTVVFTTSLVSQEVENKTIGFLLTRPVWRWQLLLSRWLAAVTVIIVALWCATLLLGAVTWGPSGMLIGTLKRDLLILPVGVVAYSAVFLLAATLLARPLLWGLLYVFGWESWVPSMPGAFKMGSLMSYLRVLAPHESPAVDSVDIEELLSLLNPTSISSHTSWIILACVITIGLLGALCTFSVKEYSPRDDSM